MSHAVPIHFKRHFLFTDDACPAEFESFNRQEIQLDRSSGIGRDFPPGESREPGHFLNTPLRVKMGFEDFQEGRFGRENRRSFHHRLLEVAWQNEIQKLTEEKSIEIRQ